MDALTKAFLEWANRKGYDTAHAYNQNESRWIFLSPMTADVYEAWQACAAELATLRENAAMVDDLRKDAERYRHIKASHHKESAFDMYEGHRLWFAVYDTKRKGLDAAIDAAMQERQP